MIQLRLFLLLFVVTNLRVTECFAGGREQELSSLSRLEHRSSEKFSGKSSQDPPSDSVYVPYRGSWANLALSIQLNPVSQWDASFTECKALAITNGAPVIGLLRDKCMLWKLNGSVCSNVHENETDFFIDEKFLTDGSPNDDPVPSPYWLTLLMHSQPHVFFRITTPTITEIPEFSKYRDEGWGRSEMPGKMFLLSKFRGIVETNSDFPIDPVCYTNSLCGVAVFTTSTEMFSPNVTLHKVCGHTMDLDNITALNVFSHEGIGCKFFPCVYPTQSCELTVTSCHVIQVKVTLVNFKKTTCEGYELKVLVRMADGVMQEHDVCKNDIDSITANAGEVKILFSGSPTSNRQRYGFNFRLLRLPRAVSSPLCSSDNSIQD